MNSKYSQILAGLNDGQKQAVEAIEGPVLVIAGPGTGKTQLLSARVANILKSTDTKASNILCLTFTNKAAVNMKERIIEAVGPAGAKVIANTFHSFAAEIMNLYSDHFWNAASLSVAPESVQLDIVESVVKTLPLDNPLALKFAGQFTLLKDLQRSINLAKKAGLTPDKLRAIAEANLAYIELIEEPLAEILNQRLSFKKLDALLAEVESLPTQAIDQYVRPLTSLSTIIIDSLKQAIEQDGDTGKCTNTSKWKGRWVQTVAGQRAMYKERERNDWWLKLADVYEQYRDNLHTRGFYDYDDMLVEVISQLEQNPAMLADIQERFNYVLIDEFQDTTPAQLRLAHLVADHHSAEGKPNLMAVGDDDQSIFKFNGAELNNMLSFKRTYPSSKLIVLTENYRSSQAILDTAKKIIEQAEGRLVNSDSSLKKDLVAKNPPKDRGGILAPSYSSRELQLSMIARDIRQNYDPKKEIVVLARGHDSLITMSSILRELEVPVRYEQASNILDHEIVNQTYLIAKLALAIQNGETGQVNAVIHKIIRWPLWGIQPAALWRLALENYKDNDWLSVLLNNKSSDLAALGKWFVWLAAQADSQPLAVTVEQILGLRESDGFTSPIKSRLSRSKNNTNFYFHGISAIQLLRSLVHEFGADQDPTLDDLVRFIEVNKQNNVVVADESPFIVGDRAVQLLTIHKAKGLEFDHVYIIDAVEDNWKPKSGGRKPPANLPLQPPLDDFDDYVRLMYVAATRAKSSLTISSYYQDHSGRDVAISSIVQAALPVKKIQTTDKAQLLTVLEENLRWPDLSGGQERQMLKARLENYNLSVTHLLNFLDLSRGGPQYFKERNLLYLPEAKTSSLSYGTAMHAAMDRAQKQTNTAKLDLALIIETFAKALAAEQMPPLEYERYLVKGKQTLTKLFQEFGYKLPKGSHSEQKLKDITVGQARLGGKLDRVDDVGNVIRIIDYKTGTPLSSFVTNDQNKALKAYKHRLQLVFYALLLQETPGFDKSKSIEGQMVYLDAEKNSDLERSYAPTSEEIERLRFLTQAVWQKIVNLDLPDVSGYSPDLQGIKAFEDDLLN